MGARTDEEADGMLRRLIQGALVFAGLRLAMMVAERVRERTRPRRRLLPFIG